MNNKYFQYIVNLYFILIFYHGFIIYIYIYIHTHIMTIAYLFKYFNFISSYNDFFSNFSYYKCLSSNASKHLKMMHKRFLKYASKHK